MREFIVKMMKLGEDLSKTEDGLEISMIINDAEKLYTEHFKEIEKFNEHFRTMKPTDCFDKVEYRSFKCKKCGKTVPSGMGIGGVINHWNECIMESRKDDLLAGFEKVTQEKNLITFTPVTDEYYDEGEK